MAGDMGMDKTNRPTFWAAALRLKFVSSSPPLRPHITYFVLTIPMLPVMDLFVFVVFKVLIFIFDILRRPKYTNFKPLD